MLFCIFFAGTNQRNDEQIDSRYVNRVFLSLKTKT